MRQRRAVAVAPSWTTMPRPPKSASGLSEVSRTTQSSTSTLPFSITESIPTSMLSSDTTRRATSVPFTAPKPGPPPNALARVPVQTASLTVRCPRSESAPHS